MGENERLSETCFDEYGRPLSLAAAMARIGRRREASPSTVPAVPDHPDWGKVRGQEDAHYSSELAARREQDAKTPIERLTWRLDQQQVTIDELKERVEKLETRQTPQAGPEVLDPCPACKGKGVVDTGSHGYTSCSQCKGKGKVGSISWKAPAPGEVLKEGEQR
jgi:hypothetical protein